MYPANPCCDFAVHCCVLLCRPATGDPSDTGRWQNPALCWCKISTACFMQEAAARGSNPLSASVTFVPGRYHPWHRARGKATDVLPSLILLRQSRISPAPCTPRWRFPWATSSHSTRSFCWWRATYSRGMSVTSSLWESGRVFHSVLQRSDERPWRWEGVDTTPAWLALQLHLLSQQQEESISLSWTQVLTAHLLPVEAHSLKSHRKGSCGHVIRIVLLVAEEKCFLTSSKPSGVDYCGPQKPCSSGLHNARRWIHFSSSTAEKSPHC